MIFTSLISSAISCLTPTGQVSTAIKYSSILIVVITIFGSGYGIYRHIGNSAVREFENKQKENALEVQTKINHDFVQIAQIVKDNNTFIQNKTKDVKKEQLVKKEDIVGVINCEFSNFSNLSLKC